MKSIKFKRKSQKQLKRERTDNADITEDGMSYEEISKILGISKREVRRIEREAIQKLQEPSKINKKLHRYWNSW